MPNQTAAERTELILRATEHLTTEQLRGGVVPRVKAAEYFDTREYFLDELKYRGLRLDQCIWTIRKWFNSTDDMTPKVAWAISVLFGIGLEGADCWLRLDFAWRSRPAAYEQETKR